MNKRSKYPQPLADRILVLRKDPEAVTQGGIVIPDTSQKKTQSGIIQTIGPSVQALKVGDEVIFQSYGFTELIIDDQLVLVMQEEDVMIVMQEKESPHDGQRGNPKTYLE